MRDDNGDAYAGSVGTLEALERQVAFIQQRLAADDQDRTFVRGQLQQLRAELRRHGDILGRLDEYMRGKLFAIASKLDLLIGAQARGEGGAP